MRQATLLAMLVALALPAAAAADPPSYGIVRPDSEQGLSQRELGKQLFAGNCSMCHGSLGEGSTNPRPTRASGSMLGEGPSLQGVGAGTVDFYLRTGYMPLHDASAQPVRSKVLFTDREIRALVAYVSSLGKGGGPPIPAPHPGRGSLSRGLQLFTLHCAGCHQVVAQGGYVTGARVPPLEADSPVEIAEAVRAGPYVMPKFSQQAISNRQLDDIVAYVDWAKNPHHPGGWPLGYIGPLPEGLVTWFIAVIVLIGTCIAIGKRLKAS